MSADAPAPEPPPADDVDVSVEPAAPETKRRTRKKARD